LLHDVFARRSGRLRAFALAALLALLALALPAASGARSSHPTSRPQTTITAKPPKRTTSHRTRVAFRSNRRHVTFQCSLDHKRWKRCSSPTMVAAASRGSHSFRVRARDRRGHVDRTPADATWTVVSPGAASPTSTTTDPAGATTTPSGSGSTSTPALPSAPAPPALPAVPGVPAPPPATPPPPPATGPADHFVSASGSDSNACTSSAPCATFQRAFNVSSGGQVIEVAGGTYPAQKVTGDKGSTVTFRGASGATIRIGTATSDCSDGLDVWASHVAFEAMNQVGAACAVGGPEGGVKQTDVTFRNLHAASVLVDSAANFSVIGGDYGGGIDGTTYTSENNGVRKNGSQMPTNVLFDGVHFHDTHCTTGSDPNACHIECIIVGAVNGLTIRNSSFEHCAIQDILMEDFNGTISNVLIENNFMADATEPTGGPPTGRDSIHFSSGATENNVLVRFNSMRGSFYRQSSGSNWRFIGNVVKQTAACNSGVTYAYNVFGGNTTCSGTGNVKLSGAMPWKSDTGDASQDYHLTGGQPVDLVPDLGSDYELADDIDGQSRPMGSGRDAGADELR
jgi:hypothetical protein